MSLYPNLGAATDPTTGHVVRWRETVNSICVAVPDAYRYVGLHSHILPAGSARYSRVGYKYLGTREHYRATWDNGIRERVVSIPLLHLERLLLPLPAPPSGDLLASVERLRSLVLQSVEASHSRDAFPVILYRCLRMDERRQDKAGLWSQQARNYSYLNSATGGDFRVILDVVEKVDTETDPQVRFYGAAKAAFDTGAILLVSDVGKLPHGVAERLPREVNLKVADMSAANQRQTRLAVASLRPPKALSQRPEYSSIQVRDGEIILEDCAIPPSPPLNSTICTTMITPL